MIIIKSDDDAATTAAIERALKGQDVNIFQSDDDEFTTEELFSALAYNAKQTRVYVGRLERNTRRMEEDMRNIGKLLEPLATYITAKIVEEGDDVQLLARLRRDRERKIAAEALKNPPTLGAKAERLNNNDGS